MMAKQQKSAGYVLMVVSVALVVVATLTLSLFAATATTEQQQTTNQHTQQLSYGLQAALAHTQSALDTVSSCNNYPTVSGELGEVSYSTSLSSNSGSPINVTLTATHSSGIQRTATHQLLTKGPATTVTLPAQADTYINQDKEDDTYGDRNSMHVRKSQNDRDEHALLQFDFASIPSVAFIDTALLTLHLNNNDQNNAPDGIFRVTQNWVEAEASWRKNQDGFLRFWLTPGGTHGDHLWASFLDSQIGDKTADITSLARRWQQGVENNGMLIKQSHNEGNSHNRYSSKDHADASLRPRLDVTYRCECGAGC